MADQGRANAVRQVLGGSPTLKISFDSPIDLEFWETIKNIPRMNGNTLKRTSLARCARPCRTALLGAAIFATALGFDANAWGAGLKEAHQNQSTQARKACLSGDYQKGVDILTDLFIETKEPVLIFNQGRCFEQNSRYEEAISRFEEYLRVTKHTNVKDRGEAEEHIADCQLKLEKSRALIPPAPQSPSELPQQNPTPESSVAAPLLEKPQEAPPSAGGGLRVAGIVVGSVGVIAVGTAVILNLKANSMASDLNSPTGYDRSKDTDHSRYQTLSWIGYGVGSACLIGGAILYGIGASNPKPSRVAFLPVLAPGHASLSLQGAF
jgi:hypothetical protein